jgi:hypothetical protein
LKSPARRKERIRMEKKGQKSLPSNRKETRNSRRKYRKTSGLKGFLGSVSGFVSIHFILAV